MHDRRAAPHALYPEIYPREVVGGDGRRRHDHFGGERFVVAVASPIEVGLKQRHNGSVFPCSVVLPVHLNPVLASSSAVSQRTPSPWRHGPGSSGLMLTLSGPCSTSKRQLKPPAEKTKLVAREKAPPPLTNTSPVGKPLTLPLKPKPLSGGSSTKHGQPKGHERYRESKSFHDIFLLFD